MRVAFLTTTYEIFNTRMKPLADRIRADLGWEVMVYADIETGVAEGHQSLHIKWTDFDILPIEHFDPNLIIVWNGRMRHMKAAIHHLEKTFIVVHMEMGWFKQETSSVLLNDIPQLSSLKSVPYVEGVASLEKNQELLENTRALYRDQIDANYLDMTRRSFIQQVRSYIDKENYIFVPMQLEFDTQILYASDKFKTMGSLLGFVRYKFPGRPIVVTNHPHECSVERPPYTTLIPTRGSTHLAMKSASLVVGINSTVLAESMLFKVPTIALGTHVAEEAIGEGKYIEGTNWMDRYDYYSLLLIQNQWDYMNPPEWLLKKIDNFDFNPRAVDC